MDTFEVDQPWIVFHYGRTHDEWWPLWNSTRVLGRCCVVAMCAVCGDRTPIWIPMPRFGPIVDRGPHPARTGYLLAHAHPDRGAPMSWKLPMLNPAAHPGGIDIDLFAMRLEADLDERPLCDENDCYCDNPHQCRWHR